MQLTVIVMLIFKMFLLFTELHTVRLTPIHAFISITPFYKNHVFADKIYNRLQNFSLFN